MELVGLARIWNLGVANSITPLAETPQHEGTPGMVYKATGLGHQPKTNNIGSRIIMHSSYYLHACRSRQ